MVSASEKIWMDGVFVDWNDASVHVLTHSLHYGLGAFEGIRCYRGETGSAIFRLREHVDRLFESAHIMMLEIPYNRKEVSDAIVETVRVNTLASCYIRPLLYVGYGEMGLDIVDNPVKLAIAAWPWDNFLGGDAMTRGIRAKVSSFTRHHVNASMNRAKISGHYVNSILARREAKNAGYDEAIFLDAEGYVSEGTGENLFIVSNKGMLVTTPLSSILEGITRHSILELARDNKIPVVEERFTRDALYVAEEAFLTGTAVEVTPIREIDNRQVGAGQRGPVTDILQQAFFAVTQGKAPSHTDWLTPV